MRANCQPILLVIGSVCLIVWRVTLVPKPLAGEAAGQRIAQARRRRGLSQAILAGLVGRSESWLSQVERGKRGIDSHSVLTRLAQILRVDIAEITGAEPGTTDTEQNTRPLR